MVQLSTTYDKTLKKKIFVLKGEEAYARTTDVLIDLISDFDDCGHHLRWARVGLEIDVLREIGKGFLNIYDNDTLCYETIPWDAENMDTIIDNTWNAKGVYWIDNKLIIGVEGNLDTGLLLAYNMEHNIKAKFSGNKQCLGSTSETLTFEMEEPDSYASTLTVTPSSSSLHTGATASFTLNLATVGTDLTKTIKVYEGNTKLDDITDIDANDDVTYTKSGLSDGLHNLTFVFEGDDESLATSTTVPISIGYQVSLVEYPSVVVNNVGYPVKCRVTDYHGNGIANAIVCGVQYISGWGYEQTSQPTTTDGDGYGTINPNYFSPSNPCSINYNYDTYNYYSDAMEYTYVTPTDMELANSPKIIGYGASSIGGWLIITPNNNGWIQVKDIPIQITSTKGINQTVYTSDHATFGYQYQYNRSYGDDIVTATCGNVSKSVLVENVIQYWDIGGVKINKNIYSTIGSFTETSNGYKLTGNSAVALPYNSNYGDVKIEFDIVSVDENSNMYLAVNNVAVANSGIGNTDHIRYEWSDNLSKLYVNDVLVDSAQLEEISNALAIITSFTSQSSTGSLIFNNLKYKVI